MSLFWGVVVWFPLPALLLLVGVLLWRRVYLKFPYFLNYIIIAEVVGLIRLFSYRLSRKVYFNVYWTTDVLFAIFQLLAVYELLVKRLFPRFYSVAFYRYLFPIAATLITLVAVPAILQGRAVAWLVATVHVLNVVGVMALVFLFGLMTIMGRRWSRYELGIAIGVGLELSSELIDSAFSVRSPTVRNVLDRLPGIIYDVSCLIWLITFLRPEKPQPLASGPIDPQVLRDARQAEQELKDLLSKKKNG